MYSNVAQDKRLCNNKIKLGINQGYEEAGFYCPLVACFQQYPWESLFYLNMSYPKISLSIMSSPSGFFFRLEPPLECCNAKMKLARNAKSCLGIYIYSCIYTQKHCISLLLGGYIEIKVKTNTQSGQKFRPPSWPLGLLLWLQTFCLSAPQLPFFLKANCSKP